MEQNYVSNSHKSKAELLNNDKGTKKEVSKVVNGSVKVKKKSEIRKLADVFIPDDVTSVKSFILMDVIVPAAKKAILDIVEVTLYGETGRLNRKTSKTSLISYGDLFARSSTKSTDTYRSRNVYDYDDIVLDSYDEALAVLTSLDDMIRMYGVVSVADYYDLVGVKGSHIDHKYGWSDIGRAKIDRTRENEAIIRLPKALPIN